MNKKKIISSILILSLCALLFACNNLDAEIITTTTTSETVFTNFLAFYWEINVSDNNGDFQLLYTYENNPYMIYYEKENDIRIWKAGEGILPNIGIYNNIIELESDINYYIRPVIVEDNNGSNEFHKENHYTLVNVDKNISNLIEIEIKIFNAETFNLKTKFIAK